MTTGELLDMIEADARSYRGTALQSLILNGVRMYDLSAADIRHLQDPARRAVHQHLVDAVLTDFINHLARVRGVDRGGHAEHLR